MQIGDARELHDLVCQARVSTAPSTANWLQHQLQLNKRSLLDLLDDLPKNAQDRKTLQEGRANINNTIHKVNDEFIKEALFVSDQLGLNEHVAASLLLAGVAAAPRTNSTTIDAAITAYHVERGYLLACLDIILKSAKDASVRQDIRLVFRQFAAELVRDRVSAEGAMGTFSTKLVKTIKKVTATYNTLATTGSISQQQQQQQQQQNQPFQFNQQQQQPQTPQPSTEQQGTTVSSGRLGEQITSFRLERLMDERLGVAQILYHITSLFWLEPDDVLLLNDTLQLSELSDIVTPYMLLALVAALSATNHTDSDPPALYNNVDFMKNFQDRMLKKSWKVPAVKAVAMVQWILFQYNAVQMDRTIEQRLPDKLDNLDKLIYQAIASKAFDFMNEYMLYFQQKNASIDTDRGLFKMSLYDDKDVTTVDPSDFTKFNADIRPDFQMFVVHELEQLTSDFILHLQHVLRKLKYKEEDTGTPVQQTSISSRSAITTGEDDSNKCRDLEKFMDLLASIYRGRINAGWQFWVRSGSHLASFVKWLVEVRQSGTVRATYNFLASISMGDVCAPRAFQELSSGTNRTDLSSSALFSWGKLFAALQYYAPLLSKPGEEVPPALPDNEEELLVTFLLLLQQVVQYSSDARQALWVDSLLRAPDSMVSMLSSRTSFGLRAALYNVLAAFCSPWGGGVVNSLGRTISEQMWDILENSEFFVTKRQPSNQQQQQQQHNGFLQSKDQPKPTQYLPAKQPSFLRELGLERASKDYKETLAVVKLLGSAIHTISRREELIGGFQPIISSVPWTLGKNNRTPGAEPYISLVIDDIFVALDSQEYLYPGAKWELAEACLKVFENSILSFDLRQLRQVLAVSSRKAQSQAASYTLALQGLHTAGQSAADMLEPLLLMYLGHPGFTVVVRLLSGHTFANAIFKIIQEGYNGIVTKKEKSPFFVQCVARSLRIINRVLELQDSFCNLLIPNITGLSSRMSSSQFKLGGHMFPPLPSLAPFGQLMLVNANAIVQVAQLVNCEDQEEICYLSTKILQALSLEPHDSNIASSNSGIQAAMGGIGAKLTNVLRGCKDEALILYGFSERLGIDDAEVTTAEDYEYDINNIPFWMAEKTLANKYAFETDFRPTLSSSVRLAIIDLLLKNSALEKPSPTLANFLLGYTGPAWQSSNSLQGLYNDESVRICLHTILDMMNRGVTDDSDKEDKPLIATHPVLAEKCYKLIYLLCAKVSTSSVTMRYLQDKDDFFYNHLRALPARFESYSDAYSPVFPGKMVCADKTIFEADFFVILSQLHQRAWLLKTIALELHILAGSGQKSDVRRILDVLYGTAQISDNDDGSMDVDDSEPMFNSRRFEQPLVKMLEIVSSLEFEWTDSLKTIEDDKLKYFAGFNPDVFIIENERDCAVYDIRAVYQILRQDQANKRQAGMLANDEDNVALEKEMGQILEALVAQNHMREISNGKVHCLRAWKQVVQVTLSECFDNFPFETREKIIYDLLSALLPKMKKAAGSDVHFLKGFSEVILTLLTRLREDKLRQDILAANPTASVGSTRLPDEKLRFIFNGILACIQEEGTTIAVRGDMYTALVNFLRYVDHSKNEFGATIQKRPYSDIQKQFIDTIAVNDKFLDMLCTDATDGLSIWKTTAYVAMDALYVLSSQMRNDAILSYFVKKNFLRYSIDMLRREDVQLLNFLEQPDVPRDDIYIYETKMSLFLRLALSKEGSKLLIENRIIEVLNHCQFINARPEQILLRAGRAYVESDFNSRYEQLLMPVLKLVSALLCTLGHVSVIDKVEAWARKQQEALLYILTDNQQVTISSLTQLKLVTSILYHLSCRQGFFDDLVTRGLNQLHTAMIHLIAKYLIPQKLASQVVPVTEDDMMLAEKQVFANGGQSALTAKAEELVFSIQMNLAAYAQNAAFISDERGNNVFKPVFSNTLTSATDAGALSLRHVSTKTPSLSTLAACIRQTVQTLHNSATEYKLLLSQERNVASLKYEEIREIAETAFPSTLGIQFDNLSPSQQQQVLAIQVEKRAKRKAKQMRQLVFILENILLVLWRHLEFYMKSGVLSASTKPLDLYSTDSFAVSNQTAMFQPSIAVASNLKTTSASVLEPILRKIQELDMGIPQLQTSSSSVQDLCDRINKIIQDKP